MRAPWRSTCGLLRRRRRVSPLALVGFGGGDAKLSREGNDLMTKLGLSHWQFMPLQRYVVSLYQRGLLGKGKKIDCDLPMDDVGSMGYYDTLMRKIAARVGIGNDLSEACARFAEKYGMLQDDLNNGNLKLTYWGTSEHYDTRIETEWGFGSLFGERDLMQHMMANYPLHWMARDRVSVHHGGGSGQAVHGCDGPLQRGSVHGGL